MKQDKPGANPQGKTPVEKDLYYFHPDHLGSSNLITDSQGQAYEHLEYFPFGETWVEESSNTQRTPYLFTAKELDEETGLYYFGARYYDPRTSVWQSADAILDQYLDGKRNDGVYNSRNLGLYSYAYLNPARLVDPDGNNPGPIYAPGVFPQVDYRTGNAIADNTVVGAVNTVINTANSIGNIAVRALGAVGEVLPADKWGQTPFTPLPR